MKLFYRTLFLTGFLAVSSFAVDADHQRGRFTPDQLVMIDAETVAHMIEEKQLKKREFQLVDLRLEVDFEKGSIPGALNIPLKKLSFMADQVLKPSDEIICYGYSKDDKASVNAVILLINKGYQKVFLLEGGFKDWKMIST